PGRRRSRHPRGRLLRADRRGCTVSVAVLRAEVAKAATLPATSVAVAVTVLGCLGPTVLNALYSRDLMESGAALVPADTSPVEAAYAACPLGTVGAIVLGVVAISSEYTSNSTDAGGGRQISATLA